MNSLKKIPDKEFIKILEKISEDGWNFAIVNSKLAEIFFDKTKKGTYKVWGHCYVEKSEYKTKKEKNWIKQDTANLRFVFRNKKYRKIKNNFSD